MIMAHELYSDLFIFLGIINLFFLGIADWTRIEDLFGLPTQKGQNKDGQGVVRVAHA